MVTRQNQIKAVLPILWSAFLFSYASAETIDGRVVGVSDGDTITVLDQERRLIKIRLGGIDAPEKQQPFGDRSKQHLSSLVFNKEVLIEWHKRDKYGRTIGKVLVAPTNCDECAKTLDANLSQLTAGMAWWYRQYAKEQSTEDRIAYSAAEVEAQSNHVGLWGDSSPTPPWVWRHR